MDVKRVDPPLPATQYANQESELDQLRLRKVMLQLHPERVIRLSWIPGEGVRVAQGDPVAVGEKRRIGVVADLR
jgi:hypothetical protein